MKDYLVVYEQGEDGGWGAHCADMDVFVVGSTRAEVEKLVTEGIVMYIEDALARREPVPEPRTEAERVAIDTDALLKAATA